MLPTSPLSTSPRKTKRKDEGATSPTVRSDDEAWEAIERKKRRGVFRHFRLPTFSKQSSEATKYKTWAISLHALVTNEIIPKFESQCLKLSDPDKAQAAISQLTTQLEKLSGSLNFVYSLEKPPEYEPVVDQCLFQMWAQILRAMQSLPGADTPLIFFSTLATILTRPELVHFPLPKRSSQSELPLDLVLSIRYRKLLYATLQLLMITINHSTTAVPVEKRELPRLPSDNSDLPWEPDIAIPLSHVSFPLAIQSPRQPIQSSTQAYSPCAPQPSVLSNMHLSPPSPESEPPDAFLIENSCATPSCRESLSHVPPSHPLPLPPSNRASQQALVQTTMIHCNSEVDESRKSPPLQSSPDSPPPMIFQLEDNGTLSKDSLDSITTSRTAPCSPEREQYSSSDSEFDSEREDELDVILASLKNIDISIPKADTTTSFAGLPFGSTHPGLESHVESSTSSQDSKYNSHGTTTPKESVAITFQLNLPTMYWRALSRLLAILFFRIPCFRKLLSCSLPTVPSGALDPIEPVCNKLSPFPSFSQWDAFHAYLDQMMPDLEAKIVLEIERPWLEVMKNHFLVFFKELLVYVKLLVGNRDFEWYSIPAFHSLLQAYLFAYTNPKPCDNIYFVEIEDLLLGVAPEKVLNGMISIFYAKTCASDTVAVLDTFTFLDRWLSCISQHKQVLGRDFDMPFMCKGFEVIIDIDHHTLLVRVLNFLYTHADLFLFESRMFLFLEFLLNRWFLFFFLHWSHLVRSAFYQVLLLQRSRKRVSSSSRYADPTLNEIDQMNRKINTQIEVYLNLVVQPDPVPPPSSPGPPPPTKAVTSTISHNNNNTRLQPGHHEVYVPLAQIEWSQHVERFAEFLQQDPSSHPPIVDFL
ncbi:hypothetical protein Pelo_15864 [Pelomyxa schiedti]|nr:hypothetical protein Pelo_15864 [Pelomyxa schiedti]